MTDERQELNFSEDVAIDLDDLHMECARHPQLRKKYADEVAFQEDKLKKIHQQEKVCRSKLILEAKEKGHTNAAQQEAYYRTHDDHIKIKDEKIQTEYDLSMAWNALKAMDDKKFSLEKEISLWIGNYYATIRENRETEPGKIKIKEIQEMTVQKQRKSLNRSRKIKNDSN